jgi:PAS domain S-box-containing protein
VGAAVAVSAQAITARLRPGFGSRAIIGAGAVLIAFLIAGIVLVSHFISEERARDLVAWQSRVALIADGRARAVTDWVERQLAEMTGLAENGSVQLYLSELAAADGDLAQVTDEAAQEAYLRNLLIVTAQRGGFKEAGAPAPVVNANIRRLGSAGIAILDPKRRLVVASPEMPPLDGRLADWLVGAPAGERTLLDVFAGADGQPAMAFLAPVFAIEGGDRSSQQVGYIIGLKPVAAELFPLLRPPGPAEPGAEAALIRPAGATVEFISPLADGTLPLQKRLARDTPDLAAGFALATPGGFGVRRDDQGRLVLATGRPIPPTPWTLLYTVDRDIALGESDRRVLRLAVYSALAFAVIIGGLVAVWYYASSRHARQSADAFQALAQRFESQGALLRLVTDSQPNAIFIADAEGRFRFANREAERRIGLAETDLVGKTLAQVLGPAASARLVQLNEEALAGGQPVTGLHRSAPEMPIQVLQSTHVPLPAGPDLPRSVLVVEQDITDLTRERERRERVLHQLVRAMMAAVDRRDHFAADQSTRVAAIARATAEEMGLDPALAETAEIAGNLMNFGKILVPPELLTKTGRLSAEEMALIRSSIQATADIIAGIEFDGPVVDTLRQMQERWDGSGPRGLKGEAILLTARIVAVANAFVAMASPRAYRSGGDVDAALTELFAKVGSSFDRRVVAALVSYLENRGGRSRWAALAAAPGRTEAADGLAETALPSPAQRPIYKSCCRSFSARNPRLRWRRACRRKAGSMPSATSTAGAICCARSTSSSTRTPTPVRRRATSSSISATTSTGAMPRARSSTGCSTTRCPASRSCICSAITRTACCSFSAMCGLAQPGSPMAASRRCAATASGRRARTAISRASRTSCASACRRASSPFSATCRSSMSRATISSPMPGCAQASRSTTKCRRTSCGSATSSSIRRTISARSSCMATRSPSGRTFSATASVSIPAPSPAAR